MTAADAIARSRAGAYRLLEDGRMALAYRDSAKGIACFVRDRGATGYRVAKPADGIDPNLPGWTPGSPKETPMAKRGAQPIEGQEPPATEGETSERSESATIVVDERSTITVEGEGAQEKADALAQALVDQVKRPDILGTGSRELPVKLTEVEMADVARQLCSVIDQVEQEEADQKEEKASMKERLAGLLARQRRLAGTLRRGIEPRMVDVRVEADYEAGVARTVRADTGEVLDSRVLTDRERQQTLLPETAAVADAAMAVHSAAAEAEEK